MNERPAETFAGRNPDRADNSSTGPFPLRGLVFLISVGGILIWLLFELQRAPYRPPFDMSTFLGGPEIAFARALMILIAIPEVALIAWFLIRVSLEGSVSRFGIAKLIRSLPILLAGSLVTYAVGDLLWDYVALQRKLEEAGSNVWQPTQDRTRSFGLPQPPSDESRG